MAYQVRLPDKAEHDVELALRWFAANNTESAAERWLSHLLAKVDSLRKMPARCPIAGESADLGIELRELLVGKRNNKYRVLFIIERQEVQVLHIRRGTRDRVSIRDLW